MKAINPSNQNITTDDDLYYQLAISVGGERVKTKFICKIDDYQKAAEMAFLSGSPMNIPGEFIRAEISSRNPTVKIRIFIEYFGSSDGYNFEWDLIPLTLCEKTQQ